jgi:hypothetical protein
VQNALERSPLAFVRENELPHFCAIKKSLAVEYLVAERSTDLIERRCAFGDNVTGDDIGVDDRDAELCEKSGDGRLATGDAASEANAERSVRGGVFD